VGCSTGIACDHHFNPRQDSSDFRFVGGKYRVGIFAVLAGQSKPKKLSDITFTLDEGDAKQLAQTADTALFLFWNVDTRAYEGHIDRHPS
jgi:hypothetical protein